MRLDARSRAGVVALLVLAIAVVVSGCGGSSVETQLRGRLLSVKDLPAGWSVAAATKDGVKATTAPCLTGLPKSRSESAYQAASFVEGVSIPNLSETLASGTGVAKLWPRIESALGGCRSATLILAGTKVRATIHPLQLARLGRSSSASAWSFTLGGIKIGFALVVFEVGGYGVEFSYADLGAPQATTVTAFARAAATKATSGSTPPIPNSISIASAPVRIAHTSLGAVAYRAVGSGPPLLLITGYSGTMEAWDRRFVDVLAQDHRVITFDNAGIGKTQTLPTPLTIDAMADQTSALIDALALGPTDVLGWSMGSMIAQALAVRHPAQVHRLVLCASYPGNGTAVRPSRAQLNAFESGQPQQVMAALFPADQAAAQSTYLAATSSYPAAPPVPGDVLSAQKQAVDAWWNGSDAAGRKASTIALPTLIADGTDDRLDPVANRHTLAALIPGATLRLYPDAGHAFLFQDEATFLPRLASFLH